jgi:hypothetical protein
VSLHRDFEQALSRREADAARGLIPVDDPHHHRDGRLAAAAGLPQSAGLGGFDVARQVPWLEANRHASDSLRGPYLPHAIPETTTSRREFDCIN